MMHLGLGVSEGGLSASADFPRALAGSSDHAPQELIMSGWKGGGEAPGPIGETLVIV